MNAIEVRDLGKMFRIGAAQHEDGTLAAAAWSALTGPFRRARSVLTSQLPEFADKEFWALRNITFEVAEGEVMGIIGANGAGKSTLLKILTRISAPTEGSVRIRGRVSSLLEVGTGFHPELTGRENVYMNGTILGMRRAEIRAKFDEIVEFSGIEDFIDTPVKRYSSGMQVRLAFSVAAHLEPEILLVDEVLSVGDAEFRRKSLNKMREVTRAGRTVLTASHNMASIQNLCDRALLLTKGQLVMVDNADRVIMEYLQRTHGGESEAVRDLTDHVGRNDKFKVPVLSRIRILDGEGNPTPVIQIGQTIAFEVTTDAGDETYRNFNLLLHINNDFDQRVVKFSLDLQNNESVTLKGKQTFVCAWDECILGPGSYTVDVALQLSDFATMNTEKVLDGVRQAIEFSVRQGDIFGGGQRLKPSAAMIWPRARWEYEHKQADTPVISS